MTHFIDINYREYISLAHVERIVTCSDGKGDPVTTFYNRAGEVIGTSRLHKDWDNELARIVPAAAGAVATIVDICFTIDRPTEEDVLVERQQIVAWRLTGTCAAPITLDGSGIILIEQPDGRLKELASGTTYDDLDAAKTEILRDAQDKWDREHNDKITCEGSRMKSQPQNQKE